MLWTCGIAKASARLIRFLRKSKQKTRTERRNNISRLRNKITPISTIIRI
jgi:hypothetical protein